MTLSGQTAVVHSVPFTHQSPNTAEGDNTRLWRGALQPVITPDSGGGAQLGWAPCDHHTRIWGGAQLGWTTSVIVSYQILEGCLERPSRTNLERPSRIHPPPISRDPLEPTSRDPLKSTHHQSRETLSNSPTTKLERPSRIQPPPISRDPLESHQMVEGYTIFSGTTPGRDHTRFSSSSFFIIKPMIQV